MNVHKNARLTFARRLEMAKRIVEQGLSCARAAAEQGALSWELRAAVSLAQLWRHQGRAEAARDLLTFVYGRFTEGFETSDLTTARLLVNDLRAWRLAGSDT